MAGQTSSICTFTSPASESTLYVHAVVTNNKEGSVATAESAHVAVTSNGQKVYTDAQYASVSTQNARPLWPKIENGNFEDPDTKPTNAPGWNTTNLSHASLAKLFEVSPYTTYNLSQSKNGNGNLVAELASDASSCLYQEIATVPGKIYQWKLDHAGRGSGGNDVMAVIIGPALTEDESIAKGYGDKSVDQYADVLKYPYGHNVVQENGDDMSYFADVVNALKVQNGGVLPTTGEYSVFYNGHQYYIYIASDRRGSWGYHSGTYTVPEGQGATVFSFANVISTRGGFGNVLDNITFAAGTGVEISNDVAYDGGGQVMTAVAETGFSYGIVEERGSTTMAVSPMVTLDGATLSVNDKLGAGASDWYTPDKPGSLVFGNLTPGKTYRVVAVPTSAINADMGTNLNPGLVLDETFYESVTIKPVADPSDGSGGNIQATAENTPDGLARIIVNPAREDVEYALVATGSDGGVPASPAQEVRAWTSVQDGSGKLAFEGLARSTSYAIVARPKGYEEVTCQNQVDAGSYVVVKTPSEHFRDLRADDESVVRSEDGATIAVKNMGSQTQRYTVYDALTGEAVGGGWKDLEPYNGDPLKVREVAVDAGRAYQVVTAELSLTCAPSPGVRAYPAAPDPEVDFAAETVGKDGVVPATVEYRMQDNADAATWYFGDADGQPDAWVQGTGGSAVSLTPALDAMAEGGGGATLSYRTHADFLPAVYVEKSVVVPARPPAPSEGASGYAFDYAVEGVVPGATAAAGGAAVEARASSAAEWQRGTTDAPVSLSGLGWTGSRRDVQVRMAAVEGADAASSAFASAANASASIPARPAAPAVQVIVDAADPDVYHFTGESSEVDASQYRVFSRDGTDGPWSACTAAANLAKGVTYEVRKAATASAFASVSVTRAASSAQVESVVSDMAEQEYGFEARGESSTATLTLKNSGTSPASVDAPDAVVDGVKTATVTMTGQPEASASMGTVFAVTGQGGEVAGGGSLAWTVGLTSTAQDNLPAGTYEAVIAVAYKDATGGDASTYFTSLCSVSLVVAKATPDAPTLALGDVAATSIALSAQKPAGEPHDVALEYSTAAASGYNDASTLAGLVPATRYDLYARTKADANHNASLPARISAYTAWAAPEPDAVVTANFSAETLSFAAAAYEAKDADGAPVLPNDTSVTGCIDAGGALSLRHRETAGSGGLAVPASDWASFALPARPDAPAVTVVDAGDSRSADGAVSFAGSLALENDAGGWTSYGSTVGGLAPGTYAVRAQATGTAFASKPASVSVGVKNYLVEFDANGGSWAAGQEPGVLRVAANGSSTAAAPAAPALAGYGLSGWFPVRGDGTVAAEAWDFGNAVTSDMTLKASWRANSYEVVFDPGVEAGAVPAVTGSMTNQTGFVYDGPFVALSACGYKRANYVFAGWAAERGGAVAYADKAEVSNLTTVDGATVTLYAVGKRPDISAAVPVNATVVVDANGSFRCPSALDPARPDAGGYFISSTTSYPLKVESVAVGLAEGARAPEAAVGVHGGVGGLRARGGRGRHLRRGRQDASHRERPRGGCRRRRGGHVARSGRVQAGRLRGRSAGLPAALALAGLSGRHHGVLVRRAALRHAHLQAGVRRRGRGLGGGGLDGGFRQHRPRRADGRRQTAPDAHRRRRGRRRRALGRGCGALALLRGRLLVLRRGRSRRAGAHQDARGDPGRAQPGGGGGHVQHIHRLDGRLRVSRIPRRRQHRERARQPLRHEGVHRAGRNGRDGVRVGRHRAGRLHPRDRALPRPRARHARRDRDVPRVRPADPRGSGLGGRPHRTFGGERVMSAVRALCPGRWSPG